MFRFIITSALFLLMARCGLSQGDYPRQILIGKDSCVVFRDWQLKYINDHFVVGLDECTETNDSLYQVVESFLTLIGSYQQEVNHQREALAFADSTVGKKDDIINLHLKQEKKDKRKIFWLKVQKYVLLPLVIAETGIIIYQSTQ